jgi:hypothetical protein
MVDIHVALAWGHLDQAFFLPGSPALPVAQLVVALAAILVDKAYSASDTAAGILVVPGVSAEPLLTSVVPVVVDPD